MAQDGSGERVRSGGPIERVPPSSASRTSKAPGPAQQAQKSVIVVWYRVWCELKSGYSWFRLIMISLQLAAIGIPVFKASVKTGFLSLGGFLFFWFIRSWKDGQRPNVKVFERNSAERSATLYRVVADLQRREDLTAAEVERFRSDVLVYIAQYVRDHRRDSGSPTIFANLLIAEGDDLVVIARDREHRTPLARYRKDGMLAWSVIATGQVQFTGDVQRDSPETAVGKPYSSILVIPVLYRKMIVGAVSIDSPSRYHFDLEWRELTDHLAPYVAMLGWTLSSSDTRLLQAADSQRRGVT